MKKILLITSCLLTLPHMSYAMDTGSSSAQEEQRDGRLVVKKTLEIHYEKTINLPKGAGAMPFPVKFVEFTQKNVDMRFSFDKEVCVENSLGFPVGFPFDLQSRILTTFHGWEILPEEPNPHGFGCLSGSVTGNRETIGNYTEKPILSWDDIKKQLLVLRAQAYAEAKDTAPVLFAMFPKGGATAEPLAVVDEESASAGDESSVVGDTEGDQVTVAVAAPLSSLEPTEVLEKVAQTNRPSLSNLRSWLKRMGATVESKERKRKIKQIDVTVGDHSATFYSRTDRSALKRQVTKFLKQVRGSRE